MPSFFQGRLGFAWPGRGCRAGHSATDETAHISNAMARIKHSSGRLSNNDAEVAADLEQSAQILGAKKVVAYPFGHYDNATRGSAPGRRGTGPHNRAGLPPHRHRQNLLPVIRVGDTMTVDDVKAAIG